MTKKILCGLLGQKGKPLRTCHGLLAASRARSACTRRLIGGMAPSPPNQSNLCVPIDTKKTNERLQALTFYLGQRRQHDGLSYFHTALFPSLGALFPSLGLEDQNYRQNYMRTYFKLVRKFSGAIVRTKLACKVSSGDCSKSKPSILTHSHRG